MPIAKNSAGASGSGSGTVTNVSSADTSISVANPTTTPVLTVASLATIAANHASAGAITASSQKITNLAVATASTDAASLANTLDQFGAPAANVSMNSHKLTSLTNGSAASDAAAFGQLPTAARGLLFVIPQLAESGKYITNYVSLDNATHGHFTALGDGVMELVPFVLINAATVTSLNTPIDLAGSTGSVVRLGIYADSGAGAPSGAPLLDAGTLVSTSTGNKTIGSLSLALSANTIYWSAWVSQGTPSPTNPAAKAAGSYLAPIGPPDSLDNAGNNYHRVAYTQTGVTGALPSIGALSPVVATGSPIGNVVMVGF